jgi:hypothetical protein
MTPAPVERDERTIAIENAGYRWSNLVLSFGLLLLTMYRSLVRHEASWDLLGLVVLGGAVNVAYQWSGRVLYRRWIVMTIVTFALAAAVAAVMIGLRSVR